MQNVTDSVYGSSGLKVNNSYSFNNLPTNGRFNVETNITNSLNTFQKTTLLDNFHQTQYQEAYPTSVNSSLNEVTVTWDFVLMGYTEMKKIYLEYYLNSQTDNKLTKDISLYPQGEYAMLDNIISFKVRIGNNQFIIGREQSQRLNAIKVNISLLSKTKVERDVSAKLGLSRSQNRDCVYDSEKGAYNYGEIDDNENIFNKEMANYGFSKNSNLTTYRCVSVPLYFLNNFFNQNGSFLPKQIPIKIELVLNIGYSNIYNSVNLQKKTFGLFNSETPTGKTTNNYLDFIVDSNLNPKIVYQYSQLKETANISFNNSFLLSPLIYNFYDINIKDNVLRKVYEYNDNFIINGSVPLDISLRVELEKSSTLTGLIQSKDSPVNDNYLNIYDQVNASCSFILPYLKIFINGVLKKDLRNVTLLSGTELNKNILFGDNCYEKMVNIQYDSACYQSDREEYFNKNRMTNISNSSIFQIILAAGDYFTKDILPPDSGSTTLTMQYYICKVDGTAFDSRYRLRTYIRNRTQLLIDNRFNVDQVKWPAISTGGNTYITPTFNTN